MKRRITITTAAAAFFIIGCQSTDTSVKPQWKKVTSFDKALGTTTAYLTLDGAPVGISFSENFDGAVFMPPKRFKENFSSTYYGCIFTVRAEGEEAHHIGATCTDEGGASPIGFPAKPSIGIHESSGTYPHEFWSILTELSGKKVYFGYPSYDGREVVEMVMPSPPS